MINKYKTGVQSCYKLYKDFLFFFLYKVRLVIKSDIFNRNAW